MFAVIVIIRIHVQRVCDEIRLPFRELVPFQHVERCLLVPSCPRQRSASKRFFHVCPNLVVKGWVRVRVRFASSSVTHSRLPELLQKSYEEASSFRTLAKLYIGR